MIVTAYTIINVLAPKWLKGEPEEFLFQTDWSQEYYKYILNQNKLL